MLEKFFDFKTREAELIKLWEKAQVAKPETAVDQNAPVFDITMPPPNANGELHIGHSYGHTVMDMFGRFRRLNGERVLLLPGKDHAGIQTQVVYEKKLREQGVEVEKMSRDEFFKSCYDFCIDRSQYMRAQEKSLGITADFEREIFTLDPKISEIVYETFVNLWNDGLIYRGSRIVHWSVYSQTAISDVEVEYKEEKGKLWHFYYPLLEKATAPERVVKQFADFAGTKIEKNEGNHFVIYGNGEIEVGEVLEVENKILDAKAEEGVRKLIVYKVRKFAKGELNEEILSKYNEHLRGRMSKAMETAGQLTLIDLVPVLEREDAIVVATTRPETMLGDTAVTVHPEDPRYTHLIGKKVKVPLVNREIAIIADDRVEIGFGTGAVKTTPAHDFLDYEIGLTHKLEQIQVIDQFGKMTEAAGKDFAGLNSLEAREKVAKLLAESGNLILTEEIVHKVPIAERGKDVIEPLISKQWYLRVDDEKLSLKKKALELLGEINVYPGRMKHLIEQWLENLNDWNISRQILWGHRMPVWYKNKDQDNEEIFVGMKAPEGADWVQETDTFDTWFSSGQWPFSTLAAVGLLDLKNPKDNAYFPTHTMVMGRDILLFWACRMMLFATYRMKNIPWKNIYFTGLVRDAKGQKMSKSKGNGVEPTEMIAKYGVDALRLGLIVGSTPGLDPKFDEKRVEAYGKFINKIWNAAKLVEMKLEGNFERKVECSELKLDSSKWILKEVERVRGELIKGMNNYDLTNSFEMVYHFSWDIFCSWYLEVSKIQLESAHKEEVLAVMQKVLVEVLKMLHCFIPMVTEEIYQQMNCLGEEQKVLALNIYKNGLVAGASAASGGVEMEKVFDIVSAARELRRVLEIGFAERLGVEADFEVSEEARQIIEKMANVGLGKIEDSNMIKKPVRAGVIKISCGAANKDQYFEKIKKQLEQLEKAIYIDEKRLNSSFVEKAEAELVAEVRKLHAANLVAKDVLSKELALN
ncbi:MAG: class I tRNA ligase family protein [Candidatus Altimarinota bacterium]